MPHYPRIRDLREDKDLTQTQMGKILSCSQRVYSNYERGDIDIPTVTLIKLADFHGVSVDYLLNRTDNPETNREPTAPTALYTKFERPLS
ncbi:MAG: helix-turn-helix transcriptional regulator [Clostridia bacterium]|nr:helix-turn-helix transcriptional regulator [Clostridia bacterium]